MNDSAIRARCVRWLTGQCHPGRNCSCITQSGHLPTVIAQWSITDAQIAEKIISADSDDP